jgi:hypothetical protein
VSGEREREREVHRRNTTRYTINKTQCNHFVLLFYTAALLPLVHNKIFSQPLKQTINTFSPYYHVSLFYSPSTADTTIYRSLGLFNFSFPVFLYFFLPDDHGLYPCFRMWLICLFMVRKNKAKKYNKRMGQNTGTSKILKRERKMEMATALAAESLAERKWVTWWKGEKNVSAPEHTNNRFDKPRQSPKRHHRAKNTYQNLNSGTRRINICSPSFMGSKGPPPSNSGSCAGDRNPRNRLSK